MNKYLLISKETMNLNHCCIKWIKSVISVTVVIKVKTLKRGLVASYQKVMEEYPVAAKVVMEIAIPTAAAIKGPCPLLKGNTTKSLKPNNALNDSFNTV